ncbi:putative F-box-like domain superfamily protein [Helianthus anomalus]
MFFYNVLGIQDTMVELAFHLILFRILIKIDTKSIHHFKLVCKEWRDGLSSKEFVEQRGSYVEDYMEMLQDQGLFINSSILMDLTQKNANVLEEMVIVENGQRTVYQVYDDDN